MGLIFKYSAYFNSFVSLVSLFVIFPIISIISSLLGITVLVRNVKSRRNIYFFFLTVFISIWIISNLLENENIGLVLSSFFLRTDFIVAPLVSLFFILFCLNFPEEREVPAPIKWVLYLFALFFVVAAATDLIVKDFSFEKYKLLYSLGILYPLYAVLHISYMGYGALTLLTNIFRFKGLKRHQSIYVFLGFFISSGIILILNLILEQIIFVPRELARFGIYGLIIFEGLTAYAITKHHLMDISVVISRTVAELLSVAFLGSIYIGLVWLYRNYISAGIDIPFIAWTVLYGIMVGQTHQRIRLFLQTTSDKVFLKGKYNYYKELSEISSQITRSLSVENILQTLHKAFYEVIEVSNPRIYIEEDLNRLELKDYLNMREPVFINKELILPCRVEERLIALIMLGPRLSEDAYTDEDLRLLNNIANQTAVALDHHRMYEEMLKAQEQLLLAEKQSSLGRVAAGLAHEIKNPLAAIKGMVQSIDQNLDDPEFISDYKAVVPREIGRLNNLVDNLLKLGKTPQPQIARTDVNEIIDNILKLFEQKCRSVPITINKELNPIPAVKADPEQLTQAFTNLILNAIQAMGSGGQLTVNSVQKGEKIIIGISDTGHGIPQDKLKDIFEPFFTTKVDGMGLGLAITYKIIKDHGGEIEVDSNVGSGTTFKVSLPK